MKMEIKNKNIIGKDLVKYLFSVLFCTELPGVYLRGNVLVKSEEELGLTGEICSDCKVL